MIHAKYEDGNIAEKYITALALGNSDRPSSVTVTSKANVLEVREVIENHERYIRRDIPNPVDISLLQ